MSGVVYGRCPVCGQVDPGGASVYSTGERVVACRCGTRRAPVEIPGMRERAHAVAFDMEGFEAYADELKREHGG